MDTKTALEVLGCSKPTYRKYRRKLGIFEETAHEISEENVMKIKRLIEQQGHVPKYTTKVITDMNPIDENGKRADILAPKPFDSAQVLKLKEHYNVYSRYIDYLTQVIVECIDEAKLPPREVSNMIEKYETLCIKIAKELRHLEGDSDNIKEVISEKMQRYS